MPGKVARRQPPLQPALLWPLLAAVAFVAGCMEGTPPPAAAAAVPPAAAATGDPIEGLRVARRVGCTGCHGRDGRGKELWDKPGEYKLYSANLTEKRALYDDAGMEKLLRQGQTHDGHRPLGMPVFMLQNLSDSEVRDITAWLRALPAVANPGLGKSWFSEKTMQQLLDGSYPEDDDRPTPGVQSPATPPADVQALGKHLAMTSCSECHGRDLNGWSPDDPTPSLIVAKAYSAGNFARLMRTGIAADGKETKTGFMSGVARERFSTLTDAEVTALKTYLDAR